MSRPPGIDPFANVTQIRLGGGRISLDVQVCNAKRSRLRAVYKKWSMFSYNYKTVVGSGVLKLIVFL